MINVILQDCTKIDIQVFFMLNHSDEFIKYISLMILIFTISLASVFVTMIAIYESQPLFEKINKIEQKKVKQQYRKRRSTNAFTTAATGVSLPDVSRIASVAGIASHINHLNTNTNNNNYNYNGNEIRSVNDSRQIIAMIQLVSSIVETAHDDEDCDDDGVTPLELASSDIKSLEGYGGAQANGKRIGTTTSNINYKIDDIDDNLSIFQVYNTRSTCKNICIEFNISLMYVVVLIII